MSEWIERYLQEVGRYLPKGERAEIEAELRSQIYDQLEDRYGAAPTDAEISAVLKELGDPRLWVVSYSSGRYLIGPELYPYTLEVLRRGWLIIPLIVVFLQIFGVLTAPETPVNPLTLLFETLVNALQAGLIFTGVIVLIFAGIQQYVRNVEEEPFDPIALPEVNDPRAVDRVEETVGVIVGTLMLMVVLYWLAVGGLTLKFNLSDPGEIIPAPTTWLLLLAVSQALQTGMSALVLRRNRWNIALWSIEGVLEIGGLFCLYFAVLVPFFGRVVTDNAALAALPLIANAPQIIVIGLAALILTVKGGKLVRLWNYSGKPAPYGVRVQP